MKNAKNKSTSTSTVFKTKLVSRKKSDLFKNFQFLQSLCEIKNPMFDNKGSIFNQIIRDKIEKNKKEIISNMKPSFPISSNFNKSKVINSDIFQTFITENQHISKDKNEDSNYVNINNNFINLLDKEIKKYEENNQKPKVKKSFNTNNKNAFNHNDEEFQKLFYLTQKARKSDVEVIDPTILEKKEKAMKKIPYIIKNMEKKKNTSVYNKKLFDTDYLNRYGKQKVNIEEILMNHNMNERKGVSSARFKNFYYNIYNDNIKKNTIKKTITTSLPYLTSVSNFDIPSTDFSSDYLRLNTQKMTI